MDDQVYEWVRLFKGCRYMNGVGFEILAHTPVPKLPLSYLTRIDHFLNIRYPFAKSDLYKEKCSL